MEVCVYHLAKESVVLQQFAAQRGRPRGDLPALIHALGLEQLVLNQPWTELSVSARQVVPMVSEAVQEAP